jgi:osmotically inducible protein OsmC
MKSLYTAAVHVTGGRDGQAASSDGRLSVGLAMPREIGGSGGGTNPEQLFAAGFAGCFTSSIQFAARQLKIAHGPVAVDAAVTLTVSDDSRYGLRVRLAPSIPDVTPEQRAAILAEAERICAYTNATAGHVGLEIAAA